ncbi:MAG: laccase domain-containing protein, partial [Sphingobium sp.]
GEDTCSQPDRFFSYRRSCLQGEGGYGRQISLIGLSATA